MGLEGFDGVLFNSFCLGESLAIVEVDEVGGPIILASLSTFRTVPGKVPYFSALETGIRLVSCGRRVALEVILRAVSLIAVGILSPAEVIASIISSVVPSRWCPVPVYVHGDRGVIHPSRGVR